MTPPVAAGKLDTLLNYLRRAETAVVVISVRHHFMIVHIYLFYHCGRNSVLIQDWWSHLTTYSRAVHAVLWSTKDMLLNVYLAPRKQYPKWRLFCGMLR